MRQALAWPVYAEVVQALSDYLQQMNAGSWFPPPRLYDLDFVRKWDACRRFVNAKMVTKLNKGS